MHELAASIWIDVGLTLLKRLNLCCTVSRCIAWINAQLMQLMLWSKNWVSKRTVAIRILILNRINTQLNLDVSVVSCGLKDFVILVDKERYTFTNCTQF